MVVLTCSSNRLGLDNLEIPSGRHVPQIMSPSVLYGREAAVVFVYSFTQTLDVLALRLKTAAPFPLGFMVINSRAAREV